MLFDRARAPLGADLVVAQLQGAKRREGFASSDGRPAAPISQSVSASRFTPCPLTIPCPLRRHLPSFIRPEAEFRMKLRG